MPVVLAFADLFALVSPPAKLDSSCRCCYSHLRSRRRSCSIRYYYKPLVRRRTERSRPLTTDLFSSCPFSLLKPTPQKESPASPLAGDLFAHFFHGIADFTPGLSHRLLQLSFGPFLSAFRFQVLVISQLTKFSFSCAFYLLTFALYFIFVTHSLPLVNSLRRDKDSTLHHCPSTGNQLNNQYGQGHD